MSFLTATQSNPCPCCGNTSAKCRIKLTSFSLPDNSTIEDSQIFCMAFREDTDTHKFTGETRDRLWGKFISHDLSQSLSNAWSKAYSSRSHSKPPIIKRPSTPKKPTFSHLLTIRDRHREIERLLAQLSLTPAHRQELIRRGFTNKQIQQYDFKSVSYQQPLTTIFTDRLAGVAPGGKHLTNKFSGLIVPIRNESGFYLGWQYRLNRASRCRYLWASSPGASSHLAEYGELPLSFNLPDGDITDHDYIALTEGVGFKPQLTANQFGLVCLGASGGLFAVSPHLLKIYLNQASNILRTKSVLLFPDAGSVRNPLVLKQYKRTIDLVESLGYTVAIAWWNQINKSCPDPDELVGDYQIISTEQFFYFGLRYCAYFPDCDGRNAVRQFLNLLQNASNSIQLKTTIALFQSRYTKQFDIIKRICWQHLDPMQKQLIHSIFS